MKKSFVERIFEEPDEMTVQADLVHPASDTELSFSAPSLLAALPQAKRLAKSFTDKVIYFAAFAAPVIRFRIVRNGVTLVEAEFHDPDDVVKLLSTLAALTVTPQAFRTLKNDLKAVVVRSGEIRTSRIVKFDPERADNLVFEADGKGGRFPHFF